LILYAYNFDNDKIYDTINKIKSVEKPVGGDTDTARKLNEEGIVYYKNKDYINASKLFEQASNADPSDLEVLNNYASALELSNQHAETLNVIEKSLLYSIDKTNPWITANNYFVKNNIQNEYSCGSLLLSLRFSKNRKKTINYYNNLLSNYDEKENIRQNRRMALDCALKRESNY
jgi:tetratricopeptide (TPR) repeat protein